MLLDTSVHYELLGLRNALSNIVSAQVNLFRSLTAICRTVFRAAFDFCKYGKVEKKYLS